MLHRQRERKVVFTTTMQKSKAEEEEGEEVFPRGWAYILLQPVEEMTVEQVFLCSPWRGPQWSKSPHCSLWRILFQIRCIFPERTVVCGEHRPFLKNLLSVEEEVYHEGLQAMEGPMLGQGRSV